MRPSSPIRLLRRLPAITGAEADASAWLGTILLGLTVWSDPPAAIAMVAVAIGIGLASWSPTGATAGALTAVPLVYEEVLIRSQSISLLELAILVAVAGIGVRIGVALIRRRFALFLADLFLPLPLTLVACALTLLAVLSLTYVADPDYRGESIAELRKTIVEPIALLVLVRWSLRRGGMRLLLAALVSGGVFAALVGLGQFVTRSGGVIGDEAYRARGPYQHPNNLALYLERIVMLVGGLALMLPRWRRFVVPVLAVTAAGLALTFSRGALAGVAVGGAALLLMRKPARGWVYYGLGLGAAVLAFAAVAGGRFLASGADGETSTRELLWRSSLKMAADHPISGVGLDQFLYQYGRRYVDPAGWPERYTSHPHNMFLDVWLRLGLPGLVVFAAIVVVAVRLVRRARLASDMEGAVAAGAIAALVAGVAHGLVDNSFFLPDLAVLTWCCLALVEHNGPVHRAYSLPRTWRRRAAVPT